MQDYTEIANILRGKGAWIRLDRPSALNTLTPTMVHETNAALDRASADKSVIALVLTGAGRAFCAGADLKFLNDLPEENRAQSFDMREGIAAFNEKRTPVFRGE